MADWIEIAIGVPAGSGLAVDDVAALLSEELPAASEGVELRGDCAVFWVPLEDSEVALAQARSAVRRLAAAGIDVDPALVRCQSTIAEAAWREAWKKYFHTTRLTRSLVIVPSWETYVPAVDDLIIHLDPGQAFGTGAHASTHLVLLEMQRLKDAGAEVRRFVDVGTGSGILSIAAVRMWPGCTGVAVDVDKYAIQTARENCEHNGVASSVDCSVTPVAETQGPFDLVLANIQADVLRDLRDVLIERVVPGGELVLSGLLTPQIEEVAAAYEETGLLVDRRMHQSERDPQWSSARFQRVAAT